VGIEKDGAAALFYSPIYTGSLSSWVLKIRDIQKGNFDRSKLTDRREVIGSGELGVGSLEFGGGNCGIENREGKIGPYCSEFGVGSLGFALG